MHIDQRRKKTKFVLYRNGMTPAASLRNSREGPFPEYLKTTCKEREFSPTEKKNKKTKIKAY